MCFPLPPPPKGVFPAVSSVAPAEHGNTTRCRSGRQPGSILRYGICAADLSGIVARYRSEFASASASAVPHGIPMHDEFSQCVGQCERYSTLADLRRSRTTFDRNGMGVVCPTTARSGLGRDGACVQTGVLISCSKCRPLNNSSILFDFVFTVRRLRKRASVSAW